MRRHLRTSGLTLIETTLVVATMVLLVGLAAPAVRTLMHSFQTRNGVQSMVEAALSSARAMAMSSQNYVGIRFEKLCTSDDPTNPIKNVLPAPQYMIFIAHEEPAKMGQLANGFKAVEGLAPIKLPETIGVIDLSQATGDATISDYFMLSNATTFSIIFSPAGKVVVHPVRVRNRNGIYQPHNDPGSTDTSTDDVFNSAVNICRYKQGMFLQDDYADPKTDGVNCGLGEEDSRTSFVIYEFAPLRAAFVTGTPWSTYLNRLKGEALSVSPYTGTLISSR